MAYAALIPQRGGDFFYEVFDAHPNLLAAASLMFDDFSNIIKQIKQILGETDSVPSAIKRFDKWEPRIIAELYLLKNRTEKDIMVAKFLSDTKMFEKRNGPWIDDYARSSSGVLSATLPQHDLQHTRRS